MEIPFICTGPSELDFEVWEGRIRIIDDQNQPYEFIVKALGYSFHLIIGNYEYGTYVCVPIWDIGCDLAALSDCFWNFERLHLAGFNLASAVTIADALGVIDSYISL